MKSFVLPFGRLPRMEFWRGVAIIGIAVELGTLAAGIVGVVFGLIALTIGIAAFAIMGLGAGLNLILAAKRLHDRGHSGWWVLIALLPILGQFWFVWNGAAQGMVGPNRYGPDVRGGLSAADVFGDGPTPAPVRRPPLVSTIVVWTAMIVLLLFGAVALFQSPSPPAHDAPPRNPPGTSGESGRD